MTKDEALHKFGNITLNFVHYYKYSFLFTGTTETGEHIRASIGGDAGDIYRLDIDNDEKGTLNNLDPVSIHITKNGNTIFEWDDY
tara:strand:+ start:1545 stop:1799 length:255 start_codon:yes stop_codon:yes gene_type:complete